MTTVVWRSTSDAVLAQKRKQVIEAARWQVRSAPHIWTPPTDMYETETAYVVRMEIAGMRQQDFAITIENKYLTISGSRPDLPDRRAYHQMELRFGEFRSIVALPGEVDVAESGAEYEDGFLIIILPKLEI
jgi:HSP20 family protein